MHPKVIFQKKSLVGCLILNDPKTLNSMDEEMCLNFSAIIEELLKDCSDISLLVVRGMGGNFSSGGNLGMLKRKSELNPLKAEVEMLDFYHGFLKLLALPIPTFALVEGSCVGAAVGLVLACDFRLKVGESKISVPFLRLGLHPGMGISSLLPLFLGEQLASFYLLTGEVFLEDHLESANFWLKKFKNEKECFGFLENLSENQKTAPREVLHQTLKALRWRKLQMLQSQLDVEAKSQAINFQTEFFKQKIQLLTSKK